MAAMRILSGLGALTFLYLAVIPSGLIYSTLNSACAGPGCEVSTLAQVLLTALYASCALALLGTAAVFADHALRGRLETQQRLPRALTVSALVIGIALFAMFSAAYPLGGAIAALLAAITGGWIWLLNRTRAGPQQDGFIPSANGHRRWRGGRI
jgi:hypothetical protein